MRMDAATESGWTNKAEEALQRIKRKSNKLQTLVIPKEGEALMLCLRQRNQTISSVLMVEREGVQAAVSYVTVVTDGPMEEILKLSGREGRLAKWAAKIGTYDISGNVQLKQEASSKINPNTKGLEVIPGKEIIEEGSGVGKILVSPDEKMHSYAIRLKFNASDHAMDYEALLAGLVAHVSKGMKDLHVFIDSLTLIAQIEGNHTPATEHERSVNGVGNHKVGISQPRSFGGYQDKTIDRSGKSSTQGEAIRLRAGDMTQAPLDGQPHIYRQFASSSEQ
ncbi:reverse transcriptase domain-containing protein [Tanacetum coccineum]